MLSMTGWLTRWRGPGGAAGRAKIRPLRPSVLLHRRRQILIGQIAGGYVFALATATVWVRRQGYVAWAAGEIEALGGAALKAAGLSVREVYLSGRSHTSRQDVLAALGVRRGDAILDFDPERARQRLLALGWVKNARVFRRLPDIIEVHLTERRPMALWQRKGHLVLVDWDGSRITDKDLARFRELPIIVGKDAPRHAPALFDILRLESRLFAEVDAATWVGGRRWDITLKVGVEIRLPEQNPKASWHRLAEIVAEHDVFETDIKVIDLRLPDRLVVRTSPAAAAKRREPGKDT